VSGVNNPLGTRLTTPPHHGNGRQGLAAGPTSPIKHRNRETVIDESCATHARKNAALHDGESHIGAWPTQTAQQNGGTEMASSPHQQQVPFKAKQLDLTCGHVVSHEPDEKPPTIRTYDGGEK
jgi:hypothetical protein